MGSWSKLWKGSKQPKKQRKYRYNAPLHIRKKFLSVNLTKDLRKRHGKRNFPVRKGDTLKIMRGQFKKKTGKVTKVDLKKIKVYLEGIEQSRRDGGNSQYPLNPSNLQIINLNLDDKKRIKKLGTNGKKASKKTGGT